jgi:hypothetical protein
MPISSSWQQISAGGGDKAKLNNAISSVATPVAKLALQQRNGCVSKSNNSQHLPLSNMPARQQKLDCANIEHLISAAATAQAKIESSSQQCRRQWRKICGGAAALTQLLALAHAAARCGGASLAGARRRACAYVTSHGVEGVPALARRNGWPSLW